MATARKPLAAMMTPDRDVDGETCYGSLVVVCDDGAVFTQSMRQQEWWELPPVPGTRREAIKAREDTVDEAKARKSIDAALNSFVRRTAKSQSRTTRSRKGK